MPRASTKTEKEKNDEQHTLALMQVGMMGIAIGSLSVTVGVILGGNRGR